MKTRIVVDSAASLYALDGVDFAGPCDFGDQVDAVVAKLKGMPKSRPQRERTLRTMISAWFGNKLDAPALDRIVNELVRRKLVGIDGVKVSYSLPA